MSRRDYPFNSRKNVILLRLRFHYQALIQYNSLRLLEVSENQAIFKPKVDWIPGEYQGK